MGYTLKKLANYNRLNKTTIVQFQQHILQTGALLYRSCVWREEPYHPYHILVSEIMLQQTQVSRVAIQFPQFIQQFPTLESLAAAPLRMVLQAWSGLGYNRRACYLQQAAEQIISKHQGIIPAAREDLIKLPGIGSNTAGSIAAFAYQAPTVFIETNIRTVFIATFFSTLQPDETVDDRRLIPLIEQTLYKDDPRRWYYALMDYGAALKRSYPNPSRKSSHHTRQAPFKGSVREIRGAIIRHLTRNNTLYAEDIYAQFPQRIDQCTAALEGLVREGVLIRSASQTTPVYKIADEQV